MELLADRIYGPTGGYQPTATPTPDHPPGSPEPTIRTRPLRGFTAAENPLLMLIVLVGIAVLLVNFSVRGSFELKG